jgi:hypothetical protein
MKTYRGGETADVGLYFNTRHLAFTSVDEPTALPGDPGEIYRRVPGVALLVVGPLLGLVYVMFLPFLGMAMATWFLASKAAQLATGAAHVVRPGWQPSWAFLSRARAAKPAEPRAADAWAEEVSKKVDRSDGSAA